MIRTSADIFNTENHEEISIPQFIKDSLSDFFSWWYIVMPVKIILNMRRVLTIIDDKFSISFIFQTVHIPWHRDYHFVGYFIGFAARLVVLIPGVLVFLTTLSLFILYILFWLAIPVISVTLTIISPFI